MRILFYGQSVTRNPWWQDVADDLRKRFPHADLEIENRAIGGYGGPVLINTAEFDLYPFYPDLVIFHVWSGVETGHQEKIIRRIRQRTTAEVLLWTSNLRWPKTVPPDGDPQHPDVLAKDGPRIRPSLIFIIASEKNFTVKSPMSEPGCRTI